MAASGRRVVALGVAAATLAGTVLAGATTAAGSMPAPTPALATGLHPHHQSTALGSWRSGVFAGFSAKRDRSFGGWRGAPISSITDYQSPFSWTALERSARLIHTWQGHHRGLLMSFSVPLWAGIGTHYVAAASGYYNGYFKEMARRLVAAGLGHAVLRLGWEFNGGWFTWGITRARARKFYQTRALNIARAWRQIVPAIRSVPGAHFTFDWCVAAGPHFRHVKMAYPGNSYVDYIGEDVYDWNRDGRARTPQARWHAIVHQGTGLAWQAKFARRHHKQLSFPEWALVSDVLAPDRAGEDDPYFIRHMHHWFATHDVGYENYFDHNVGLGVEFALDAGNGRFTIARTLYQHLWGIAEPAGHRRT
jgi:hypothetical protein